MINCLAYEDERFRSLAEDYASKLGISSVRVCLEQNASKKKRFQAYRSLTKNDYLLILNAEGLQLQMLDLSALKISVDFCSPQMQYRVSKGGGKSQMIAKALGLKPGHSPKIIDATAGLGKDAFVLASLGCRVQMYERNPIVQLLLEDGFRRAHLRAEDPAERQLFETLGRLSFSASDILDSYNTKICDFDALYLDPMFPHPESRSLVKKDMQVLQSIVGTDLDASEVFETLLSLGIKRLVVKRPKIAPYLLDKKPNHSFVGKRNRFDVYTSNE